MRRSRHAAVLAALGIVGWSGAAEAAFTDLQFGKYQVADSQWNPGQCTTTDTCSISSKVPGVAYKIPFSGGQVNWGANNDRYIAFVPNTGSNAATYPLQMTLFEADGTVVESLGTGRVLTAGLDANGDSYFFFIGNDEWTGQLFSGSVGMDNNGPVTLTGTLAPTLLQLDTFSANMSTAPLAAGEVFTPNAGGPEPVPVPVAMANLSLLERVLASTDAIGAMKPLTGSFLNVAENVAMLEAGTGAILNRIDGSVSNTLDGVTVATASVAGSVLAIEEVTVDIGNISTTVLGAVNTGEIGLGVNQDLNEAIAGSSRAVSGKIVQLGGAADTAVLVANISTNATSVAGSVVNRFTALNGTVGNISTTVLGAVNTGTVVSGVNSAINSIQNQIVGG